MTATMTRPKAKAGKAGPRWRTITAKYPGTCRRCKGEIHEGERVRWAKRAGTWHLSAECSATTEEEAMRAAELDAAMVGLPTYLGPDDVEREVSDYAREIAAEMLEEVF